MSTTVGEANDVSFDSYSIQGVGNEPAIAGAASILSVGQVSKPLEGNNGVYVVKVTSEKAAGPQDLASEKFKLAAGMNYRANTEAFQALKEYAKIVDKRAKFY
jgi:peptidyl-prolyl cis-trans isomerase D